MNVGLQIALVGLGTYLIRVSAIAVAGRVPEPSPSTLATMRLIGPAVLAAIVADQLFLGDDGLNLRWTWLVAAVAAVAVAVRWKSAGITMAAGMVVVWILEAVA